MPRLFVAIDLPDEVRQILLGLCSDLSGARWVGPEQLHLTLRFIGEVDERHSSTIRTALADIRSVPFQFSLAGVGQFPSRGAPRVLWVGVEAPSALLNLQRAVESALVCLGVEPEERPFSPHITLSRFKAPPSMDAVRQYAALHRDFRSPAISAASFILYSSVLSPRGPVYHRESIYPLTE